MDDNQIKLTKMEGIFTIFFLENVVFISKKNINESVTMNT